MKIPALAILILFSSLSCALANDTAFGGSGSAPMPIGQTEIEMVSEHIVIEGKDIGNEKGEGRWDVTCDYTFKNTSGKEISLSVGFPFPVYDEEIPVSIPKGKSVKVGEDLVYDFKVLVNGKEVPYKKTKISANEAKGLFYKWAYIWEMKFAPNETLKVRHNYTTGVTWDVMGYSWASYVLKTGAGWKSGRIGSAKLEVVPNEMVKTCSDIDPKADYLRVKPSGMKVKGSGDEMRFVWELNDFNPTEDLDICMQTRKNYALRNVLFPIAVYGDVEKEMAKLSSDELRKLRNTVFARHGRMFNDLQLQEYFDKQWWYKRNTEYTDAMLTDDDRRIIKQISVEETRRKK